jgi:hypothetical protein
VDYVYNFDLYFTSKEDYESKVTALLEASGQEVPENLITYITPDSVFANGVNYSDNFATDDMMDWFPTLLINAGYIDSSDKSNIFKSGTTTANVMGESDEESYYYGVDINTIRYQSINGISIYHKAEADGTFDRKVVISIPQSTMDAVGEEVKSFLAGNETEVAAGSWTSDNGVNYYTLEANGITAEQVNSMMAAFCGTPGETVFWLEAADNSVGNSNLFFLNNTVHESLDLQDYISNSYSEVNLAYYVDDSATYNGELTADGYTSSLYTYSSDTEGYYSLFTTRAFDPQIYFTSEKSYTLTTANLSLNIMGGNKVARSVELYFAEDIGSVAADTLKNRLNTAFGDTGLKLSVCESLGKGLHVIMETECPVGEEAKIWNTVFGCQNTLYVGSNSNAILTLKKITSVSDHFAMSPFTTQSIETVNYTIKNIGDVTAYGGTESSNVNGSYVMNYSYVYPGYLSNEAVGVKTNILAYVVLVLAGILVLNALVQILILLLGGKKKEKAAQAPAQAAPTPAQTAAPAQAPAAAPAAEVKAGQEVKARFCSECGAKIVDPDVKFCANCGAKIED